MKSMFSKLAVLLLAVTALLAPLTPLPVYAADAKQDVCTGLKATTGQSCGSGSDTRVNTILKLVLNVVSFVVGFAAVIMLIIGGLRYVMSSGDGSNTAGAKNTILYAVIGLAVVALAQIIVRFVLDRAT